MKNNYATINIDSLDYEMDRFRYLKGREPVYLILNSDTLCLVRRRTDGLGEMPVAVDSSLRLGEIVIL